MLIITSPTKGCGLWVKMLKMPVSGIQRTQTAARTNSAHNLRLEPELLGEGAHQDDPSDLQRVRLYEIDEGFLPRTSQGTIHLPGKPGLSRRMKNKSEVSMDYEIIRKIDGLPAKLKRLDSE